MQHVVRHYIQYGSHYTCYFMDNSLTTIDHDNFRSNLKKPLTSTAGCLPSEEESQQWSGKIQTLVAIVIPVVHLTSPDGGQQQPMHHVTVKMQCESTYINAVRHGYYIQHTLHLKYASENA